MKNSANVVQATIRHYIAERARNTPDKSYYLATDSGATLSYAALQQQCSDLGRQFQALGFGPGDKVSVYMPNCQTAAVVLLGIMANGLVANPVNLMSQASQLRHVLWHSDTRMVFTTAELAANLQPVLAEIDRHIDLVIVDPAATDIPDFSTAIARSEHNEPNRSIEVSNGAGTALADHDSPAESGSARAGTVVAANWPALLMYTSGTTGVPKGVVLTHDNLVANALNISAEQQLTEHDRVLGSLPLYHINGLVVTLVAPLIQGGSVAMTPRFSVASFWQDAVRYECTWLNVVPTIVAYLLNDRTGPEGLDISGLRFCRTASAALSPDHLTAFEERFGIGIIETMGLTETAAPAFSNPYDRAQRRLGSVGRPSGSQAKIIDDQGRELANYQHGEIVLSGRNIMQSYYKDPERTREAFTADGWLRTGDIGYRDDEGFFYIIGRAKELIIKGGENIAPREIDEAVVKHPSVLDAAAVGIPHPEYGQDIAVYLVLREDAQFDDSEMHRHCVGELGRYKAPSKYVVVDELPRGPSGKVQRLKLLDM